MIEQCEYKNQGKLTVGKVTIALTNPSTGQVLEFIEGQNHVFQDVLTSLELVGSGYGAVEPFASANAGLSTYQLWLSDSNLAIDPVKPYLKGNLIGYGIPGTGGDGAFRGAASTGVQVIANIDDVTKVRYKFQYEFTPTQANGVIKAVALTNQFTSKNTMPKHGLRKLASHASGSPSYCHDRRYSYYITTAGVLTKYDKWKKTTETKDLSTSVGATENKRVCYAPRTGKYYILKTSATAGSRWLYEFSDNTFTTLTGSYPLSNSPVDGATDGYQSVGAVYGEYLYLSKGNKQFKKINFVNNTAPITITLTVNPLPTAPTLINLTQNSNLIAEYDGIYMCGDWRLGESAIGACVSPDTDTITTYFYPSIYYASNSPVMSNPLSDTFILGGWSNDSYAGYGFLQMGAALTTFILPTPITKTSANGLTVTYELEVSW